MGFLDRISAFLSPTSAGLQVEYSPRVQAVLGMGAEELWRSQPHLRTVVTFLARNIAQLGLHSFQRVTDTDRQRLIDDPIARLLKRPNNHMTTYEIIFALVADLALYDEAFWAISVDGTSESGFILEPLSPSWVTSRGGSSAFTIDWVEFRRPTGGDTVRINISDLLWFKGWNPGSPRSASSPVESLKHLLAEQIYSQTYRQQIWQKAGRLGGILTRPVGAKWDAKTREKFQRQWQAKFAGNDGPLAGGTPILEDGMTYNRVGFSAHEDDYVEGAKLAFATVASVYHVNPTMVGILDNANFSNVREFRSMLYGDTLGSTISMIEDRINTFLVPLVTTTPSVYVEFNIAEKLQGSFEEQAQALSSAAGRPYMTANEARAKLNLPSLGGDADSLVTPLNVLVGGQASSRDSGSQNVGKSTTVRVLTKAIEAPTRTLKAADDLGGYTDKAVELFAKFFKRQRASVLSALGSKANADWWDGDRWDTELTTDLFKLANVTASELGKQAAEQIGYSADDYDVDRTLNFLKAVAESRASAVNSTTRDRIESALDAGDDPAAVFDEAESARSGTAGVAFATTMAGFAVVEAAKQLRPGKAEKTWEVNSRNPRPEHAALDGETVGIEETFSNGADWPGDPVMGAEGNSNCDCTVSITY